MNKKDFKKKQQGQANAQNGIDTEKFILHKFNGWDHDAEVQEWLMLMGYVLSDIDIIEGTLIQQSKTDVQLRIKKKGLENIFIENIQIKLLSKKTGLNQVDKRWLKVYKKLWDMPEDVFKALQYFTGELEPYKKSEHIHRMLLNELDIKAQKIIINWFNKNKNTIISDLIKGRGELSAQWYFVLKKNNLYEEWSLRPIKSVLMAFSKGSVAITSKGSLIIGGILMQRKGGDAGRSTANMLQFKLDPSILF